MTEFKTKWTPEIKKLERKGFWEEFIQHLRSKSPGQKLSKTSDNDLLHGGVVYASKEAGFGLAIEEVSAIAQPETEQFEPEDKFKDEEKI